MSLKSFRDWSDEGIRRTARRVFEQWAPLWRHADTVSILFWTGDGSELLEYDGDEQRPLEWACWIGGANPVRTVRNDPDKKALHSRGYPYCDDIPTLTYAKLRRLVALVREGGHKVTGRPVRIGTSFDPGPEFAKSRFKVDWHPEVCKGGSAGQGDNRFITCYAVLKEDNRYYAGFPEGVPAHTPFGTFFGRQCRLFCEAMGFDYVWFSNGFGFGREPWRTQGVLFDEKRFNAAEAKPHREAVLAFWDSFRRECPDLPVEVRGTNLTAGVDLSTDAVPHEELLRGGYGFTAPPNSPWAALDGDFGLELAGYMTRIAELPDDADGFPFRFYVHDPWWMNSPWLDRYERQPHDIYMPLSVGRLDEDGRIQTPHAIELLSIDDSLGRLPEQVPNEVAPHILAAAGQAPDRPGPVVWIYPFAEYHAMAFGNDAELERIFAGDWLVRAGINQGMPLNTVVSSRIFQQTAPRDPHLYRESILVSIVPPADSGLETRLLEMVEAGARVLFYGSTTRASQRLSRLLNLAQAEPISGDLDIELAQAPDPVAQGSLPTRIRHRPLLCDGGCVEVPARDDDPATTILASYRDRHGRQRVAALCRSLPRWHGGRVAWVRGTNSMECDAPESLPKRDDPMEWLDGAVLMKSGLTALGWETFSCKESPEQRSVTYTVSRHNNGFYFSGYLPDNEVAVSWRTPMGAPLLLRWEGRMVGGRSTYRLPRAWREQCRVFIDGQQDGRIACREIHSGAYAVHRRMVVRGLRGAILRFYPERGSEERVTFLADPRPPYMVGRWLTAALRDDHLGHYFEIANVTGDVLISW